MYVWAIGSWAVEDDGGKTASRYLREWMGEMPGTGSLASCISPASARQGSVGWVRPLGFYCLVVWFLPSLWEQLKVSDLCPALKVSCISCCGRLWHKTDCPLQAASGEPLLDFRNAYHGLRTGLVMLDIRTWKYAGGLGPFEGCIKMLDDFRGVELSHSCCPGLCS